MDPPTVPEEGEGPSDAADFDDPSAPLVSATALDRWAEAERVDAGPGRWPDPNQFPDISAGATGGWVAQEAERRDMWRRLSGRAAGRLLEGILTEDHAADPSLVPELLPNGDTSRRALGMPGGRFYGIYNQVLLQNVIGQRRQIHTALDRFPIWRIMRGMLRVLDLDSIVFTAQSIEALFGDRRQVTWPHLTHLALTGLQFAEYGLLDRLLQQLYAMPRLVYVELETSERMPPALALTESLTDPGRVRRLLVQAHQDHGHWAFQRLRVLRLRNMGWRRFPLYLVMGLVGPDPDSQYLQQHQHPGLRSSQHQAGSMPRFATGSARKAPQVRLGTLRDYAVDLAGLLPRDSRDWLDLAPHLTHLDLQGVDLRPAKSLDALQEFRGGCALWMARARLKARETEWNTYQAYEREVAFPFYNPLGSADGRRRSTPQQPYPDVIPVRGGLRPWRIFHSSLDLGEAGVQFPKASVLSSSAGKGSRATDAAVAMHGFYLHSLLSHGRPKMNRSSDRPVRLEQGASLLAFLAGVGLGGDAWRILDRWLGDGRSLYDGRGLALFHNGLVPLRSPIRMDLVPAAFLLRSLDRPLTLVNRDRWPLSRASETRLLRQDTALPKGLPRLPVGTAVTHVTLRNVSLAPALGQRERWRQQRLLGSGSGSARALFALATGLPRLAYLEIQGGDRMPRQQQQELASYFVHPRRMMRLMVGSHRQTGRWPLQYLSMLRLQRLGLSASQMPWALVAMAVPLRGDLRGMGRQQTADAYYLRIHYPQGRDRGHVYQGQILNSMTVLPRLMHLDLQHNRLMDTLQDPAERRRRSDWFIMWMGGALSAARYSDRIRGEDWRGLGLKVFESRVDTDRVIWSHPGAQDAPHLNSYMTVDLRHNPVDLDAWDDRERHELLKVHHLTYMSHVPANLAEERATDVLTFLMENASEYRVEEHEDDEMFEEHVASIVQNVGRGAWVGTVAAPLTRGFALRIDGDYGVMTLLHRLVAMSAGYDRAPLYLSLERDRPEYGMDLLVRRRKKMRRQRAKALETYREALQFALTQDARVYELPASVRDLLLRYEFCDVEC